MSRLGMAAARGASYVQTSLAWMTGVLAHAVAWGRWEYRSCFLHRVPRRTVVLGFLFCTPCVSQSFSVVAGVEGVLVD